MQEFKTADPTAAVQQEVPSLIEMAAMNLKMLNELQEATNDVKVYLFGPEHIKDEKINDHVNSLESLLDWSTRAISETLNDLHMIKHRIGG